jgi:D-alanyl-lipoteichoic acid acyltransferase DltB (MBOAT superfamily)
MLSLIALYVLLAYPVVRFFPLRARKLAFAALNVAIALLICVRSAGLSVTDSLAAAVAYVTASLCCYWAVRRAASVQGRVLLLGAIVLPILFLIASKLAGWPFAVGASYAAFRASYLAVEIESGKVPPPDVLEFVAFLFFVPTFLVGPISPYRYHQTSLANPQRAITPLARSAARIVVGWAKYTYVGELFHRLTFQSIWYDGYRHGPIDFAVAAACSYLFLYFNFSGFCDVAIGAAGLLGIKVKENFDNPLIAENVPDFWRRWHITLSDYMRDVFFLPFSRWLMHGFGPERSGITIPLAILTTFLLIGIWHGIAWNYVMFGLLHGGAVTAHFVYTQALQRRTTPEWRQRYAASRAVVFLGRAATFSFVSGSFLFLENDMSHVAKAIGAFMARGGL